MSAATQLSFKDRTVLGALFDPEASLDRARATNISHPSIPQDTASAEIAEAERNAINILSSSKPSRNDISSAISQLALLIKLNPNYASAYVNRAQARRLEPGVLNDVSKVTAILSDLDTAISLATPVTLLDPISKLDARVLASAHTHIGYLLMRASTSTSFRDTLLACRLKWLHDTTEPAQFEELASRNFGIAGRHGNKTAQQLAVKTNPYARLCGQIVKEALRQEIREYYEGVGITQ